MPEVVRPDVDEVVVLLLVPSRAKSKTPVTTTASPLEAASVQTRVGNLDIISLSKDKT